MNTSGTKNRRFLLHLLLFALFVHEDSFQIYIKIIYYKDMKSKTRDFCLSGFKLNVYSS